MASMQSNEPPPATGTTFSHQDSLPKLPIPDLKDTLDRFVQTVGPLLDSEKELEEVSQAADELLKENGWGVQTQQALKKYAETVPNYVEEFWDDAYLNIRSSLVTHVNPIFVLEDDPTPSRNNQVARASRLILSSLKFVEAIRQRTLTPDVVKGTPLCMSQFDRLFGSARVPDPTNPQKRDKIITDYNSTHIAVVCRGQFYYFDALWPDGRVAITEREISSNLQVILNDAAALPDSALAEKAVGVLTSGERTRWAKQRGALMEIERNAKAISKIDSALFVMCLDHQECESASDFASNVLHGSYRIQGGRQVGNCLSRWYDKLQFIVAPDGTAGVNFEHSAVDGHTVLRFASDAFTDTIIRFAQAVSGVRVSSFMQDSEGHSIPKVPNRPDMAPFKLEFEIQGPLVESLRFAEASLSDEIVQTETQVLEFTGYGKRFIVENKMSPDAFVQVAIMMGYYDLYGSIPNVYESVQTKTFLHGRTEAGRSATFEALEFCRKYCKYQICNPQKQKKGESVKNEEIENLITLLRNAVRTHSSMTSRCAKGLGVDRHLYSLTCLAQRDHPDKPLPKFFSHRAWKLLNKTIISTSNCGNPSLRQFGFGPVTKNGFGIGYIIKQDCLHFCVTSKHRQTARYLDSINRYLCTIQDMLIEQGVHAKIRKTSATLDDSHTGYGFFDAGEQVQVNHVGRRL